MSDRHSAHIFLRDTPHVEWGDRLERDEEFQRLCMESLQATGVPLFIILVPVARVLDRVARELLEVFRRERGEHLTMRWVGCIRDRVAVSMDDASNALDSPADESVAFTIVDLVAHNEAQRAEVREFFRRWNFVRDPVFRGARGPVFACLQTDDLPWFPRSAPDLWSFQVGLFDVRAMPRIKLPFVLPMLVTRYVHVTPAVFGQLPAPREIVDQFRTANAPQLRRRLLRDFAFASAQMAATEHPTLLHSAYLDLIAIGHALIAASRPDWDSVQSVVETMTYAVRSVDVTALHHRALWNDLIAFVDVAASLDQAAIVAATDAFYLAAFDQWVSVDTAIAGQLAGRATAANRREPSRTRLSVESVRMALLAGDLDVADSIVAGLANWSASGSTSEALESSLRLGWYAFQISSGMGRIPTLLGHSDGLAPPQEPSAQPYRSDQRAIDDLRTWMLGDRRPSNRSEFSDPTPPLVVAAQTMVEALAREDRLDPADHAAREQTGVLWRRARSLLAAGPPSAEVRVALARCEAALNRLTNFPHV